jgi:hypothetical protein
VTFQAKPFQVFRISSIIASRAQFLKTLVSIRRAGLTTFWECQAGAPNGHGPPGTAKSALVTRLAERIGSRIGAKLQELHEQVVVQGLNTNRIDKVIEVVAN